MRRVEFHPEAQEEFISAAQFYEHQTEGLGLNFHQHVRPNLWIAFARRGRSK